MTSSDMAEQQQAPIIAFAVDKGGVGKTTATINTAAGLAERGFKILLVDADQQANLSSTFLWEEPSSTLFDVIVDEKAPLPIVSVRPNLDLVAASSKMFGIGIRLVASAALAARSNSSAPDCRGILRRVLAPMRSHYDYIIIDCPPSDNIMTINALYASTSVIVVAQPEPFCLYGVKHFVTMMREVKQDANPELRLAGILINNVETGAVGHRKGEASLRAWAPRFVFETVIRHSRPISRATLARQDVFSFAPSSIGAEDFKHFVSELITSNRV